MKNIEKALKLESRRMIYDVVSQYPGLHFREIVRRVEMSSSNVEYHLHYLVKEGIATVVDDGNLQRYYVAGKVDHSEKKLLSVLRKEIPRGIVLFLLLNPHADYQDILENFDLSPSQLSYYLKKLMDKEIIKREKRGKSTQYVVLNEETVAHVLISYQPTFLDNLVESFVDVWLGKK